MNTNQNWLDEQIRWNTSNISGRSLIPHLKQLRGNPVGCEIGVNLGVTSELIAKEISSLTKLYSVDSYPTYTEWNGVEMSQERQSMIKEHARNRLLPYMDKIEIVYDASNVFVNRIDENALDFIFIDGDHSYNGATEDFHNFYCKVKSGGIFAGHDIYIKSVESALRDFLKNNYARVQMLQDTVWMYVKE